MKKSLNSILVLGILLIIALACEFSTANLADVTFAKDKDGNQQITSVNAGETAVVHSAVRNASGDYQVKFEIIEESSGKKVPAPNNVLKVNGSRAVYYTISFPPNYPPGNYKIEVTLLSKSGDKEFDKKSGTLTVNGG